MTLLEIATFCAESIGMDDPLTIATAKKYARHRWKMMWDNADWKQGYHEVIGEVPANTEEVELPVEVELVKAVRIAGNRELLPSSQITQIGNDPAGFGNTGPTYAFSPVARSEAGAVRIRLHRPLSQAQQLLFICKKKCEELAADSSKPSIPGCDQTLIAFVQGDLYRWPLRQHSKSKELQAEAMAHLEKMKEIETIQTAQTVRFVPFTEPGGYSAETDWLVGK
jgi:hypothetical protein